MQDDPAVQVHLSSEVAAIDGAESLERVTLSTGRQFDCRGMSCFIGGEPATEWLPNVARDENGSVLQITDVPLAEAITTLALIRRSLLPFETRAPFVFASGDARRGTRSASPPRWGGIERRRIHASRAGLGSASGV